MSTFPHANKVNFFVAVDRWQATFILEEAARLPGAGYASTSSDTTGLAGLSAPATQLLFAEPSLLEIEDIASFVDTGIARTPSTVLSSVVSLGITPSLIRMLRSTDAARRDWAKTQLAETVRRKVSFEILVRTGVRDEIEELCRDQSVDGTIRWGAVRDILRSGGLSDEAVTRGLLAGEGLAGGRQQGGQILASLVPVLGTQSDRELHLLTEGIS
jgi:senataxin